MATSFLIELDRDGIQELLGSSEVQDLLMDKGEAVARAARGRGILVGGEPGTTPLPVAVVNASTDRRARVLVFLDHPAGLAVEAKHRLLVGSLDAGRL